MSQRQQNYDTDTDATDTETRELFDWITQHANSDVTLDTEVYVSPHQDDFLKKKKYFDWTRTRDRIQISEQYSKQGRKEEGARQPQK